MINLIVFGGTGKSGLAVLRRAVKEENVQVTVYVRRPERIPEELRKYIHIHQGDALDEDEVSKAMKNQEIVISCLGKGANLGHTTLISEGTKNVVKGMRANGIKKLFVVSISTRLPSCKTNGPWILRKVAADHDRMLNFLKTCDDIEWSGLMVPEIFNLPLTNDYKVEIGRRPGPITVTSADMADFMVSTMTDVEKWNEYKNQLIGMSSTVPLATILTQTTQGKILVGTVAVLAIAVSFAIRSLIK